MILDEQLENWARGACEYFTQSFGLDAKFALMVARLYICFWAHGLQPRITSGYRALSKQLELQRQWDSGNRAGLRARPAGASKHTLTDWVGRPASKAIDMPTNDDARAAQLARQLGIGAGFDFKEKDPGHYYLLG